MFLQIWEYIECYLIDLLCTDEKRKNKKRRDVVLLTLERDVVDGNVVCVLTGDKLQEPIYALMSGACAATLSEGSYQVVFDYDALSLVSDPVVYIEGGRYTPRHNLVIHIGEAIGQHYTAPSLSRTQPAQETLKKLLTKHDEVYIIVVNKANQEGNPD